jgi:hypothetical protein
LQRTAEAKKQDEWKKKKRPIVTLAGLAGKHVSMAS